MSLLLAVPAQASEALSCADRAGGGVLVVDPFSAGNLLAPEFTRRGLRVEYLLTDPEHTPPLLMNSFRPPDFADGHAYDGNYAALLARARQMKIKLVLPGTETGVPLADRLSEDLGIATNGTALTMPRRHKGHTGDRMRDLGLPFIPQIWGADFNAEVRRWVIAELRVGPVIVKPVESAGTDDIFLCHTVDEAEQAFRYIRSKPNFLGLPNEHALIQRFMHDDEYNLDVVSSRGRHRLAWIWKYHLIPSAGAAMVVDWVELMDPHGPAMDALVEQAFKVADGLGVRFGPTHTEFFGTTTLLEAGTRLGGVLGPPTAAATNVDPVRLVADAYLEQEEFIRHAGSRYTLLKHAAIVGLNNSLNGRVLDASAFARLKTLKSYHTHSEHFRNGAHVPRTVSIPTALGFVQLIHPSRQQVMDDYREIRRWGDFLTRPERTGPR